jgi:hypothetical protein
VKSPRKKSSKNLTQSNSLSAKAPEKPVTPEHMENLIKSTLHNYLQQKTNLRQERTVDLTHLDSIISEYLDCFIIIGYDMANSQVSFVHAKDQKDADALSSAINRFFYQSQNNIRPQNNDD